MANQKRSKSQNWGVANPTVGTQTQRVSTPPPPGIAVLICGGWLVGGKCNPFVKLPAAEMCYKIALPWCSCITTGRDAEKTTGSTPKCPRTLCYTLGLRTHMYAYREAGGGDEASFIHFLCVLHAKRGEQVRIACTCKNAYVIYERPHLNKSCISIDRCFSALVYI